MSNHLTRFLSHPELRQKLMDLKLCHPDKLIFLRYYAQYFETEEMNQWMWKFFCDFFAHAFPLRVLSEDLGDDGWVDDTGVWDDTPARRRG